MDLRRVLLAQDGGNESMRNCNAIRAELDGMRLTAFGICGGVGAIVGVVTVVTGGGTLGAAAYLASLCGGLASSIAALEYQYNLYCR